MHIQLARIYLAELTKDRIQDGDSKCQLTRFIWKKQQPKKNKTNLREKLNYMHLHVPI